MKTYRSHVFLLAASLVALTCPSPSTADSAIYKQVLPDGTVVYSDQRSPGAKKIEPPPPQIMEPLDTSTLSTPPSTPAREPEAPPYTRLAITAPANDEVIWDGPVEVAVSMEPALDSDQGHSLVLLLDNQPVTEASQGSRFQLDDVARGTHVLAARIEGSSGTVLLESEPVTFHLRQHSMLTPVPQRQPVQQPPPFQPNPQRAPFQQTPQPPPFGR